MVCCAFAVLILLQILTPVRWLRRAAMGPDRYLDAAAMWTPAQATAMSDDGDRPSRRPVRLFFAGAIGLQIFLLGLFAPLEFPILSEAARAIFTAHEALCGALGV